MSISDVTWPSLPLWQEDTRTRSHDTMNRDVDRYKRGHNKLRDVRRESVSLSSITSGTTVQYYRALFFNISTQVEWVLCTCSVSPRRYIALGLPGVMVFREEILVRGMCYKQVIVVESPLTR